MIRMNHSSLTPAVRALRRLVLSMMIFSMMLLTGTFLLDAQGWLPD